MAHTRKFGNKRYRFYTTAGTDGAMYEILDAYRKDYFVRVVKKKGTMVEKQGDVVRTYKKDMWDIFVRKKMK